MSPGPFWPGRKPPGTGPGRDPRPPRGRCRPVLPDHPQRGLEPGGRHCQDRLVFHRPGGGRACRVRRKNGLRLFGRHLRSLPVGRCTHGAQHCGGGAFRAGGCQGTQGGQKPQPVPGRRSDCHAGQHGQGGLAGEGGAARPCPRSARGAGHGRAGQRIRRGAGSACRWHPGRRCAPAGAPVRHGDCGAGRSPGGGLCGRGRAFRPGVFRRRPDRALCGRGGQHRTGQPGIPPRAGRRNDGGARARLARHPVARGRGPRTGGRLQPQGLQCLQRAHRPARGRQGRDRAGRRHAGRPARLAQCGRRGPAQRLQCADRGRHSARLHPGSHECPADERGAHRQWPA